MHDQTGWFVDDEDVRVFIDNGQIHGLGLELPGFGFCQQLINADRKVFAAVNLVFGLGDGPVIHIHPPCLNPLLQAVARMFRHRIGQHLVEPAAPGSDALQRAIIRNVVFQILQGLRQRVFDGCDGSGLRFHEA